MDDVIYEEFKGTGNMELHLSRRLQERRIFPAFDIGQSSTRREELLLGPDLLPRAITMRRMWGKLSETEDTGEVGATEKLLESFRVHNTNEEFLNSIIPTNANGSSDKLLKNTAKRHEIASFFCLMLMRVLPQDSEHLSILPTFATIF